MTTRKLMSVVATIAVSIMLGQGAVCRAADDAKKDSHTRVDELPKPIPEVMDAAKRVGDEASKGAAKVGKAVRDTADKAMKKDTK
ncbi:MAG: hypothetical protein E6K60_07830 [Nitrospirae bacterium]|nr:MAG: hypothetical protein E6K60_07830 [Nitrospirota bacterium]